MKTCPKCNAELPDRARFCSECGVSQDPLARTSPSAQATLNGSGAIGQNHGVAAGAHGTAIGTVQGSVYIGPQPRNPVEALAIYRRVIARSCGQLPLRGVDIGAADPTAGQKPLSLTNVYVDLDTTAQASVYVDLDTTARTPSSKVGKKQKFIDRADARPFTALEAAIANRQLVLLGDPGGGKSTFVNHLAHCLAMQALEPQSKWLDRLPGWPGTEAGVLPIVVILRDFTRGLSDRLPPRAEPSSLWDFIVERLKAQNLGFAAGPIREALDKG
jgi:hypothetical protein